MPKPYLAEAKQTITTMAVLNLNNKKQFDQQVWQTETDFDSIKYKQWLDNAAKTIKTIRQHIEDGDTDAITDDELNILGDVANMLDFIQVDSEYRAESWTCIAGDFDKYDTSHIDEDEMEQMIDEVAKGMQNSDNVADTYWDIVEYIAEQHGCKEDPDPWGPDDDEDEDDEDE